MPVTIHVNGTSNSLVHKGSMGFAKSTLPDVCKTPSPGGPVPIPYPIIISMSSQLVNGTTTVKVDGGNMAAIKGSELSMCNGDEAGTAGGVKSSTFMKEAAWLLYSFDVKMDGKNVCRLSDKLQMNHGNTACLSGFKQKPVKPKWLTKAESEHWDECKALHDEYKDLQGEFSEAVHEGGEDKLPTQPTTAARHEKPEAGSPFECPQRTTRGVQATSCNAAKVYAEGLRQMGLVQQGNHRSRTSGRSPSGGRPGPEPDRQPDGEHIGAEVTIRFHAEKSWESWECCRHRK